MEGGAGGTQPWIDDDGILRAVLPARRRTVEDVTHFAESARRLLGGRTARLILDARHVPAAQPEAYVRATENVQSFASAVAFVVSETTPHSLKVFQAQIDSFLVPCRLFDDVEAAEEWIKSLDLDTAVED